MYVVAFARYEREQSDDKLEWPWSLLLAVVDRRQAGDSVGLLSQGYEVVMDGDRCIEQGDMGDSAWCLSSSGGEWSTENGDWRLERPGEVQRRDPVKAKQPHTSKQGGIWAKLRPRRDRISTDTRGEPVWEGRKKER